MITGCTEDLNRFNMWFGQNYPILQKYCKKYRIEEDYIHESYCNIAQRILRSGYTENFFMTYVKRTIHNMRVNDKKKENGKHFIEIGNEDYTNTIENQLQLEDEIEKDTAQYREDVLFFSRMMFKFINEKQYNEEWQFIFRCYYLMPNRFTYAKLHTMTGYNKNHCTKVIQTMKQDIRQNFLTWLNNDNRRNNCDNGQTKVQQSHTTI